MTLGSVQLVLTSKIRIVPLPNGYLHLNGSIDKENMQPPKNVSISLMKLPLHTLHELHQGVANEIKVREQWALMLIKDAKITSQQMCDEKHKALQDCDEETARRVQLEHAISRVCS